jgi:hypothetical protein
MLEVELNTLDPKSFDNIQDFFTKFKSLLLSLGECGIDKSTQEKQLILTILAKLGPEYTVYVSNFHYGGCLLEQIGKCLRWLSSLSLLHKRRQNSYIWASLKIPKHMHSPCRMEEGHSNRIGRRDIPNPLMILQVPKALQIPRRRRRESSALTAINQIMKNPHA